MAAIIRLEWHVDSKGYDIVERVADAGYLKNTMFEPEPGERSIDVVARGGLPETYVVEGIEYRIFEQLANSPLTREGVLAFANKWGLLHQGSYEPVSYIYSNGEEVDGVFYSTIKRLRGLLELGNDALDLLERAAIDSGPLYVRFGRMRRDSHPRLFAQPASLRIFCWLELMQVLAGGASFQVCLNCGAFFTRGVEKGTRGTRLYCSDRCRVAMHRKRKSEQ